MGKRDTILKNLKLLTKKRKLSTACQDWLPVKPVVLNGAKWASCELCGTAFKRGAMMRRGDVVISVGGTCLMTLHQGEFSDRSPSAKMTPAMNAHVEESYGDVCDPGDWFNWLYDKVSRAKRNNSIATLAVRLYCGEELTDKERLMLFEYHDSNRLYPVEALFPHRRRLTEVVDFPIKSELTLKQARALLRKHGSAMVRAESEEYLRERLQPLINSDMQTRWAYENLTVEAKHVVIALCKLAEYAEEGKWICEQSFVGNFDSVKLPPRPPLWVWNKVKGIGVIGEDAKISGSRAEVWLWNTRSGEYEKNRYDLIHWLGVQPRDASAIGKLEVAAFSPIPL